MTAPRLLFSEASNICARCDGEMVIRKDAVGHDRHRCPRCDRLAPPPRVHPDDALIPQGLVRFNPLPVIEPGQLRCQICAKGVVGNVRFHDECRRGRKVDQLHVSRERHVGRPKCLKCGREMPRKVGRPRKFCETCA